MKILIVEDDQRLANNLRKGLAEEGYAVDAVYTGLEGQQFAESIPYDLIILDLGLPDKDGLEVCRSLREHKINSKILMLTGRAEVTERIKGLDCGADDYLVKPPDFGELCARVKALLRREPNIVSDRLIVDDLVMDTTTRQVWQGQREIKLAPREFAILEYLMRHPDEIVSRTMLEQRVWNSTFAIGSNVVDAFMSRLRDKLTDAAHDGIIETVRGKGYRLRRHGILQLN